MMITLKYRCVLSYRWRMTSWLVPVAVCVCPAACDRRDNGEEPPPGTSDRSTAGTVEQRVFFHDMIQAYQDGNYTLGRELARRHLAPAPAILSKGGTELDVERGFGWMLAVLHSMLLGESQRPPRDRLGEDPAFVEQIERVILAVRTPVRALKQSARQYSYAQRELKYIAREWILARAGRASRGQLEELYRAFEPELRVQGLNTLDAVLQYQAPEPPPAPTVRTVDQMGDGVDSIPPGPPIPGGPDDTDQKAPEFHRVLEEYVKGGQLALYAQLRSHGAAANEVWNHAVFKFAATFEEAAGGDEKVVRVTNRVTANDDITPPSNDTSAREPVYVYIIAYGANNGIPRSDAGATKDWISVGGQASCAPAILRVVVTPSWAANNPNVSEANVRADDAAN